MTEEGNTGGRLLNVNTEFERFFNDIVEFQKSQFKNMGRDFPPQALWLIKDGKISIVAITTTPDGAIVNDQFTELPAPIFGRPVRPERMIRYLITVSSPQAYITVAQGWMWKKEISMEEMREIGAPFHPGTIADLPAKERLETLLFVGRSMDGTQVYTKCFEIKREIHGDDNSNLVDMVELEGCKVVSANQLNPMV